ncbi:histone deacetylase 14 [Artemisia annua]|uniref:Histone deacetylase 14 n=1 Tax=Artemisia annua TaxID=35608 RepID=A0A2U1KHM2_ARTAN|nr:histone deacetylase 14 [Artemisia annua]
MRYSSGEACRQFFLTIRTKCSIASPIIPNETKVIYSAAPALGHHNHRVPSLCISEKNVTGFAHFRGSDIIQLDNIRTATMEEITSVHSRSYVSSLEEIMAWAKDWRHGVLEFEGTGPSYVTTKTLEVAVVSVGTGLSVIDSIVAASKLNVYTPIGFALIRPPGNHAAPNAVFPMGYCVFNNIAIAARYAQCVHGLERVFIIDFDVFHGNGTNDAFYDDPDVFFLSVHQDGGYPRDMGKIDDIGYGNGEGTTINLALPERSGDIAMQSVFNEVIAPAAQRFKPDIILVSAGYDGHVRDPLGNFQMTTGGYYTLSSNIKHLAKDVCGGRCVFFLEGGYFLNALANSVVESFRGFVGEPSMGPDYNYNFFLDDEPSVIDVIQRIKHLHSL